MPGLWLYMLHKSRFSRMPIVRYEGLCVDDRASIPYFTPPPPLALAFEETNGSHSKGFPARSCYDTGHLPVLGKRKLAFRLWLLGG